MVQFLTENSGTIFVGAIVIAVIVAIVLKMRKDKAEGKSCSCGCGCEGCPSAGMCHK